MPNSKQSLKHTHPILLKARHLARGLWTPSLPNSRDLQHSRATLYFKHLVVFSLTNYLVGKRRGHSVSERYLCFTQTLIVIRSEQTAKIRTHFWLSKYQASIMYALLTCPLFSSMDQICSTFFLMENSRTILYASQTIWIPTGSGYTIGRSMTPRPVLCLLSGMD